MDFPQQFGKYTLLRRLATGGMAEIFLARQIGVGGFEKDVVVKRLLPEHAAHPDFVSMFLDEARIAAHLTHPNIAQIFDLGQEGDDYYIAMEYVRGADLRRLCSQGIAEGNYLPLHLAIRTITEVCDALAYAHTRTDKDGRPMGIVHRDVSPTNVLVTFDGGVKLVDFGIAKAANKVSVTKVGQIKGKYGYMSPEQCRGDALDARSDIFAVGINLYEITLGRRLFRGDSDVETIRAIESGAIPAPRSISPDYPATLERIVLRALAQRPEDRYAQARDLQMALEDFLAECGLRATSGMLAEYMRQLFREQLEQEAPDGSGVRALPRPPGAVVPTRPVDDDDGPDETLGDAAPEMLAPAESAEVLTSAQPVNDGPTTRVKLSELTDDDVVDGRRMSITRLPPSAARPKPPELPAQLSSEPSIDELMEVPTPSIELVVEASGVSGPLAELRPRLDRRDETPLAVTGARPAPPPTPAPPPSSPRAAPTTPAAQSPGA
ncbi:serine/threonine protein kinase, partial [Myxococcota bacterium]|nr:serine/threonine protein kinase [Myxococcota bacterium]